MTRYDTLLHELAAVPPFKAWSLTRQPVARLTSVLHPAFTATVIRSLTPVFNWQNRLLFKEFVIENSDYVPKYPDGPLIFIANHTSYLDPPLLGFAIYGAHKFAPWFMAKKRLWEKLNYRVFFSALGALPYIRRGVDVGEHVRHLRAFVSLLKARQPLLVFPEGTIPGEIEFGRSGFCKLRSHIEASTGLLKTGALVPLLALASGARVIPIGISGTGRFLPPEVHPARLWPKRRKRDHHVKISFGPVIDVAAELRPLGIEISDESLSQYANQRLMPAISRLIDFQSYEPPLTVPLRPTDYVMLRDFEQRVAEQYRAGGRPEYAKRIVGSLEDSA